MNKLSKLMSWCSTGVVAVSLAGSGAACTENRTRVVDENDPKQRLTSRGLDPQDFSSAATKITNQMLSAPRIQKELASLDPQDGSPLMVISRIRNDSGLKINMVDYLVAPIEEVLVNSGKVDFVSEDQQGKDIAAGQQVLGRGGQPKLPDFVMHGVVSRLQTSDGDVGQNAYVFQVRVTRTLDNVVVFQGSQQVAKQFDRPGVSF